LLIFFFCNLKKEQLNERSQTINGVFIDWIIPFPRQQKKGKEVHFFSLKTEKEK